MKTLQTCTDLPRMSFFSPILKTPALGTSKNITFPNFISCAKPVSNTLYIPPYGNTVNVHLCMSTVIMKSFEFN